MSKPRSLSLLAVALLMASVSCHDIHIDFDAEHDEIRLFDDLYSVSVVDDDHAVAVGYYGSVYWTDSGGENWNRGITGTLVSLYGVSMADPKNGWAVGQRGLILRTEDGGRNWTRQANLKEDQGSHLFGVAAIDKDTAWVVGEWGTRIRTRDGGATWEDHSFVITEDDPMFVWLNPIEQEKVRTGSDKVYDDVGLNDVYCLRAPHTNCWLIGEFGYIYYSDDAGETWKQSTIEGSAVMDPVVMGYNELKVPDEAIPRLNAFAAGVSGEKHLNVAIEPMASLEEIRTFGRSGDPTELFEILEARAGEVRLTLEDAGVGSDRIRLRGQPPWDFEDYLENDPRFLTRYLESRTAPDPSVKVRVIQNPVLFTVRFQNEKSGMIAGLGGVILLTRDGGQTWAYRKMDLTQAVFAATSVDGRAFAVGEKGFVRVSTDNGDSWKSPEAGGFPRIFTYMRDIGFEPGGRVGFIVGQRGKILRTEDAGYKWIPVLPPPENEPSLSS